MDHNDINNFKKLTPIFSKHRPEIITLDDNKLSDELKNDKNNDLKTDEKSKESIGIVKISKKVKKNKLRDSGDKSITTSSDLNNTSTIQTTKKSKKKEILLTQTTGNTNVKEMPLNPFDFIWDTNSLMPKIEENMECLSNNDLLSNLKISRNKTSMFGAKLAKLNENEKALTDLNINELIIPTLTSTIASFANNNISSENTMMTNTTIANTTPTAINNISNSNNNSSNSSNNNTIEKKKLTKKKKEKANSNNETNFENNNDQTISNPKPKKSKKNKSNDTVIENNNQNVQVNQKTEENLVLVDEFNRQNQPSSSSSGNGDSIKISTKKAKQQNIMTEVDVGNMNISLI